MGNPDKNFGGARPNGYQSKLGRNPNAKMIGAQRIPKPPPKPFKPAMPGGKNSGYNALGNNPNKPGIGTHRTPPQALAARPSGKNTGYNSLGPNPNKKTGIGSHRVPKPPPKPAHLKPGYNNMAPNSKIPPKPPPKPANLPKPMAPAKPGGPVKPVTMAKPSGPAKPTTALSAAKPAPNAPKGILKPQKKVAFAPGTKK